MGKPNPMTLKVALDLLGLPPERCLMVGDRIVTDILMGKKTGLATALVMTGVTSWETLEASEIEPDYVLNSVVELRTR